MLTGAVERLGWWQRKRFWGNEMAYGDYNGQNKPNKGIEGGACNRTLCQAEPANYYNHGSMSWYCVDCARDIGCDVVNARCWPQDFARLFPNREFHPMFETRSQMDARDESVAKAEVEAKASHRPSVDEMMREVVSPYFRWPNGRDKEQSSSLKRMLAPKPRRV